MEAAIIAAAQMPVGQPGSWRRGQLRAAALSGLSRQLRSCRWHSSELPAKQSGS